MHATTVEYLASAIVGMKLRTVPSGVANPDMFERATLAALGMPMELVVRHRLLPFGHLFPSAAYSAGYCRSLWSDVMVADTLAAFVEAGSDWDPNALLRNRGVPTGAAKPVTY